MPLNSLYGQIGQIGNYFNYVSDFINNKVINETIIKGDLGDLVNQMNNSYLQLEDSFRKISTNDPIVTGIAALVIGGSCLFLSGKVAYDIFSKKEK
jgi:hypothetical protein